MTVHDAVFYKKFEFKEILLFTRTEQGSPAVLRVNAACFHDTVIFDLAGRKLEVPLQEVENYLFGDVLLAMLSLDGGLAPLPWHQLFCDPALDPALLSAMDANRQRIVKAIERVRASADHILAAKAAGTVTGTLVAEGRALASEAETILSGNNDLNTVQVRRISEDYTHPKYLAVTLTGAAGKTKVENAFVDGGSDKTLAAQSLVNSLGAKEIGHPTRLRGALNLVTTRADVRVDLGNGLADNVSVMIIPDDILQSTYGRDFIIGSDIINWAEAHGVKI